MKEDYIGENGLHHEPVSSTKVRPGAPWATKDAAGQPPHQDVRVEYGPDPSSARHAHVGSLGLL